MNKKKEEVRFFEKPSEDFKPQMLISGCYLEWQEKVLLLKRSLKQYGGNHWCLPGGKLEKGEHSYEGALRELEEETGICLKFEEIQLIGTVYLRILSSSFDYSFSIYYRKMCQKPKIKLNLREHIDAKWLFFDEAFRFPLISGGTSVLKYCSEKIRAHLKISSAI